MSALAAFSKSEVELLVSLPYKVGMWVSYAEDAEGEDDDVREIRALEGCIKAIAGLHADKPFLKEVAAQTLALRSEWPRWGDQAFNALEDAEKAVMLLKGKISAAQAKSYRAMIMEIATVVAQAYGEFGQFDTADDGFFARVAEKFRSLSHDDKNHPMNISAAEETAISELSEILKKGSE